MLRKRSRQVTSKQAIVNDQQTKNQWISHENQTKPSSFFLTSPRFFKGFFNSNNKIIDPMMSPTSILDTNPFSIVSNLWVFDNKIANNNNKKQEQEQHAWEQPSNKQGITLALIDEINSNSISNSNGSNTNETKQQKRKLVVFGSQLRIQIPPITNSSSSSESPREFGIKTPRNNKWPFGNSRNWNSSSQVHPEECMNEIDIDEESEDYTCVISHGPNPKTTHIFGNCIVENCCAKIIGSSSSSRSSSRSPSFSSKKSNGNFNSLGNSIPSQVDDHFLSFCHHCKKKLGHGRDIFMYRGEKAFCSEECRCQEMLFDGVEN